MRNLLIAAILAGLVAISCNRPRSIRPGVYASSHFSITDKFRIAMLYNASRISTDSDLLVNDDSTFKYLSYGMIHTGIWKQQGDSLMLYVTNVEPAASGEVQVYDNLSKLPDSPIAFRITGNRLEQSNQGSVKVLEFAMDRRNL